MLVTPTKRRMREATQTFKSKPVLAPINGSISTKCLVILIKPYIPSFFLKNSFFYFFSFFFFGIGYDWQNKKLDPCVMNVKEGEEDSLPHLVQISINLDADGTSKDCSVEPLHKWNKPSDFPSINPSSSGTKNTYIYAAAASGARSTLPHFPFDTIVKVNVSDKSTRRWSAGARRFVGEPIFVPKGVQEDDGYLLVVEVSVESLLHFIPFNTS